MAAEMVSGPFWRGSRLRPMLCSGFSVLVVWQAVQVFEIV